MGYSHYFEIRTIPSKPAWDAFLGVARRILGHPAVAPLVCAEDDTPDEPPVLTDTFIKFNGKGEAGHETFFIARKIMADSCKTGGLAQSSVLDQWGKSYDVAVCAVLLAASRHFSIELSTDGEWDEEGWQRARVLYGVVTSDLAQCPWKQKACGKCRRRFKKAGHNWGGLPRGDGNKSHCWMCAHGYETEAQAEEDLVRQMEEVVEGLKALQPMQPKPEGGM